MEAGVTLSPGGGTDKGAAEPLQPCAIEYKRLGENKIAP